MNNIVTILLYEFIPKLSSKKKKNHNPTSPDQPSSSRPPDPSQIVGAQHELPNACQNFPMYHENNNSIPEDTEM